MLGLSLRQVRRLVAAYRKEGAAALAHGNRGRQPAHTIPEPLKVQVRELALGDYRGVNHCHFTELLAQREGLCLCRSTVRRIFLGAGLRSPRRRRPPRHRSRRERYPQEGMLLQVDGSRHRWLEGRGLWLSLIAAVDEATGTVPYALFREQTDTQGYFLLLKEANRVLGDFLPRYNARFAVPAAQEGSAYRSLPEGVELEGVLCFKYRRSVAGDNTVRFGAHSLQLLPEAERASYAHARVEVQAMP